ncbi:MAG: hypothetical protein ACOYBP_05715 [Microbacteriaceae bacterium]
MGALAGCSGAVDESSSTSSAGESLVMTKLGEATFAENHAGITGTADLLVDLEGNLVVSFTNVQFPSRIDEVTGSLTTLPTGQPCLVDGRSIDFTMDRNPITLGLVLEEEWDHDPRLMRTLVLAVKMQNSAWPIDLSKWLSQEQLDTDCDWGSVAEAPIVWRNIDTRPNLLAADGGVRDGANGDVTLADGQPAAYTIANGDFADAIAARFAITGADLRFLNPYFDFSGYLQPGHILVLSTAWRGLNANQSNGFGTPGWISPPQ